MDINQIFTEAGMREPSTHTTLTPFPLSSAFTSPDIRPTGTTAIETAETCLPDLDMEEIRDELYEALQHIENLRRQYPYEASGGASKPVQDAKQGLSERRYGR
ncbi:hypothetical protein AB0L71_28080 [Streptomyces sp. NPDC052052]|uniref:hypothetical protein n=1 Tax=Streptomyces sp. NPDC052052 TaxID=3154756 RepID=UPI0034157AC5